jgi:hypothetical protein
MVNLVTNTHPDQVTYNGRVAQLVARSLSMRKVSGSNPDSSSDFFLYSEVPKSLTSSVAQGVMSVTQAQ